MSENITKYEAYRIAIISMFVGISIGMGFGSALLSLAIITGMDTTPLMLLIILLLPLTLWYGKKKLKEK